MRSLELLAPAKNIECGMAAISHGADAVYIGGKKYSLRANATNFTLEEIKEGCTFAHHLNKKVYLNLLSEILFDTIEEHNDYFLF